MDKRDKYAMGLLGAGLSVFVVFLSCTFYSYKLTQDVTHLLNIDDSRLHEIQRIVDSLDPSLETHRRSSYLLAKETFVHHGELINFTNEAGKEELFQPTKDDKEIRKTVSILKGARNSLRDTCVLWASIFCVSLFAGMLMPLSKSRNVIPPIA